MPSFLSGFGKRKAIKYGTAFPGSNLTDFPKLFTISADTDIAAELASGGGIAVTAADGTTTVPFGLYPSSDPTSGDLILRALFSPLTAASTGDTLGYLYYDSGQTTTQDKAGVVANGYALFMPLEEDPSGSAPQIRDWVTDTLIGTSTGGMVSGDLVPAVVGNGLSFNGSDHINLPGTLPTPPMSVEVWITPTHTAGLDGFIGDEVQNDSGLSLSALSDQVLAQWSNSGTSPTLSGFFFGTLANGVTTHVSLTLDGSGNAIGYQDGASAGSLSGIVFITSTGLLTLGKWIIGFNGAIDEVRVSTAVRTADWIAYAHTDDFTNSSTFSLGTEESSGGASLMVDLMRGTLSSGLFQISGGMQ